MADELYLIRPNKLLCFGVSVAGLAMEPRSAATVLASPVFLPDRVISRCGVNCKVREASAGPQVMG